MDISGHTQDAHAECVSLVQVASSEVHQIGDSLPNFDAGYVSDNQRVLQENSVACLMLPRSIVRSLLAEFVPACSKFCEFCRVYVVV